MLIALLLLVPLLLHASAIGHRVTLLSTLSRRENTGQLPPSLTNFKIISFCLLPFWASRTPDSTESDIGIKEIKRKNIVFGTSIFYTVKETKCIVNMTDVISHSFNFRMPLLVFFWIQVTPAFYSLSCTFAREMF